VAPKEQLAGYQLIERIGRGGMAEVWRAQIVGPSGFNRAVAIKRILPHLADDEGFLTMFKHEARLMARLYHPNIVQTFELGEAEGELFMTMELISGWPLVKIMRQLKQRDAPPPPGFALYIVREVCRALGYAHRLTDDVGRPLGLVHRDVSPHNVMVTFDGSVKLLDFGIAKAVASMTDSSTRTGVLKGKLSYMAPEHLLQEPLDHRADQFALGVMLHELLTGERLFTATNDLALIKVVAEAHAEPPSARRPELSREIDRVCLRALARERDARFADCEELGRELDALLEEERFGVVQLATLMGHLREQPDSDAPPPAPKRTAVLTGTGQRRRVVFPVLGVVLAGTLTGALIARWPRHKAQALPSVQVTEKPQTKTQTTTQTNGQTNPQTGTQTNGQTNPQTATQTGAQTNPQTAVRAAVVQVIVESAPAGAEVRRGAELLGRTPLELPVDPSEPLTLALSADGHAPQTLDVDASLTQRYRVQLSPLPPPPPKHAPPPHHHHKPASAAPPAKAHDEIKNGDTVDPFE